MIRISDHEHTEIIDKKKYVVIEKKEYDHLLEKAALKKEVVRKLSLNQGRKVVHSLIDTLLLIWIKKMK